MPLRLFLAGLLLLTALGLGIVGYAVTRAPVTVVSTTPLVVAPLTVDVLVAAHSLPAGTLMKEEDFAKRAIPSADVPRGALTDNPEVRGDLRGALLRHYLETGNTLMTGDVLHPRDRGFLAAVLAPGARAISIGVDAITGNGGLIWPGDRVDVILTQELNEKDAPLARRFVGETVLNDVRVVAVDQSIARSASDNITGRLARTVTLEVTPQQAERAVVAERLGMVTLAIRAADGVAEATDPRASIYGGDVSAALADGGTGAPIHMRVIEGKGVQEVTFQSSTGSRRFMPPSEGPTDAR
jgi:pilus assembly protein CpaB